MIRKIVDYLLYKFRFRKYSLAMLETDIGKQLNGIIAFAIVESIAREMIREVELEYMSNLKWYQKLYVKVIDFIYELPMRFVLLRRRVVGY